MRPTGPRLRRRITLEGVRVGAAGELRAGHVSYRVIAHAERAGEPRAGARSRLRLRSAKILDAAHAFVCEALIKDRSPGGLRLVLARNVGLPGRFGVHDDLTGEVVVVASVWRSERTLGVRILPWAFAPVLEASERRALGGRYYGVRN